MFLALFRLGERRDVRVDVLSSSSVVNSFTSFNDSSMRTRKLAALLRFLACLDGSGVCSPKHSLGIIFPILCFLRYSWSLSTKRKLVQGSHVL
jgi:hypothetical protein